MAKKKEVNKYDWYSISGEKYWQIIDILQSEIGRASCRERV